MVLLHVLGALVFFMVGTVLIYMGISSSRRLAERVSGPGRDTGSSMRIAASALGSVVLSLFSLTHFLTALLIVSFLFFVLLVAWRATPPSTSAVRASFHLWKDLADDLRRVPTTLTARVPRELTISLLLLRAQRKRGNKAQRLLDRARQLDPHHPEVNWRLADWQFERSQWQDAVSSYRIALRVGVGGEAARRNYAIASFMAGDFDSAIHELEALRQLSPQAYTGYLAYVFIAQGEYRAARELVHSMIKNRRIIEPHLEEFLYLRAVTEYFSGERPQAVKDLQRLYAHNAKPEYRETMARMSAGDFSFELPNGRKVTAT
jgi:hypothetical protein